MSYLLLSGRLCHQNLLSLLWLASNFDLNCPSLCCSMASGGLSISIHSPCCSADCQMPSLCYLCYPCGHQKTKIHTQAEPIFGYPAVSQLKKKEVLCIYKSMPRRGNLTPILIHLEQINTAATSLHAQHLPVLPFPIHPRSFSLDKIDEAISYWVM